MEVLLLFPFASDPLWSPSQHQCQSHMFVQQQDQLSSFLTGHSSLQRFVQKSPPINKGPPPFKLCPPHVLAVLGAIQPGPVAFLLLVIESNPK